ncbi:MAG: hypothetical protein LBC38_01385, partial [Oscillospiraceae bacterium]|nr:hypothetical protein [Oscillospiraceae bacterium]
MQIKPESIGAVNSAEHYCRPRLQSDLEKAAGNFIVYAFGGTGYGKTQAIRTFIESLEGVCVFWMQMTENDNIPFAFWENFCYSLSKEFPALAEELRAVGFPNTDSKFKRFVTMIRENLSLNSPERTFVVYDDFHIITDERIVNFFERMSNFKHLRLCSIAISHSPPPPFLLSKLSKEGLLSILDEDVFRFTRSEIEGFMRQEGLTLTDIDAVLEETKGWAMAIRLLAIALKHAR